MTATSDPGRVRVTRTGRSGNVVRLSLDRPSALNALTPTMVAQLLTAATEADRDPRVMVVLLDGGTSTSFCAGADVSSTGDDAELEPLPGPRLCSKPVVAAVRGWTVGVGLKLACSADLVVAASNTVLWAPEARVGIMGAGDLVHRLLRQLPYRAALELVLTGSRMDAARARQLGLFHAVVEAGELDRLAIELAERIVNSPVDIPPAEVLRSRESTLALTSVPQPQAGQGRLR